MERDDLISTLTQVITTYDETDDARMQVELRFLPAVVSFMAHWINDVSDGELAWLADRLHVDMQS